MLRGAGIRAWRFSPNQSYALVLSLFTNGEPGWLFDNSRADTLYSDLAGTVPAVLDGPIGRQTSIAGTAGIYRTTTATANRPTWSGLYNLLKWTQDFSQAGSWSKTQTTATAAAATAPDGTNTGSAVFETAATSAHNIYQSFTSVSGVGYTWRGCFKANGRTIGQIQCQGTGVVFTTEFDLSAVTTTTRVGSGTATLTALGNGWFVLVATATATAAGTGYWQFNLCSAANATVYAGDITKGMYVWGADLRPTDQTVTLPAYQWVTTGSGAGTYDVNGFPLYIKPNGSSQFLYIPSLALGTATMFVATGVRKITDASFQSVVSNYAGASSNNFSLYASGTLSTGAKYAADLFGTSVVQQETTAVYASPETAVVSWQLVNNPSQTPTTGIVQRVNAAAAPVGVTNGSSTGVGNMGSTAVYFFQRYNGLYPLQGFETCSIGRGAAALPSAAQIASTEAWTNMRTKAYA